MQTTEAPEGAIPPGTHQSIEAASAEPRQLGGMRPVYVLVPAAKPDTAHGWAARFSEDHRAALASFSGDELRILRNALNNQHRGASILLRASETLALAQTKLQRLLGVASEPFAVDEDSPDPVLPAKAQMPAAVSGSEPVTLTDELLDKAIEHTRPLSDSDVQPAGDEHPE